MLFLVASIAAGAIASVSGFGIGSILTPTLALMIDTRVAVAAVAIPHFVGTAFRSLTLWTRPDWSVLLTFGAASAAGALLGAVVQPLTTSRSLEMLFGVLLLFVAIAEVSGLARYLRFEGLAAWIAGGVSGLLGGLVGNQGGIRSAALLGFNLKKETFVATATAIALVIDMVRLPVYFGYYSEHILARSRLIVFSTVGVLLGTVVGARFLREIPEQWFRPAVAFVLAMLGLSMLVR